MKKLILLSIVLTLSACGNSKKNSTKPAVEIDEKIVFVTASDYSVIDIGGASNLDQICQDEADLSPYTVGRSFLAFYSVNGLSFQDRAMITSSKNKWFDIGSEIGASIGGMFVKGGFNSGYYLPINSDQYGNKHYNYKAWTNTDIFGYKTVSNEPTVDCYSLTSNDSNDSSEYSTATETGRRFTRCDTSMRIICVEI